MNTRTEIRAHREPWVRDTIAIRIAQFSSVNGVSTVALAAPPVMTTLTADQMAFVPTPTLQISPEEAQQFMDELWRVGIRPTEGSGSVGQLGAVKSHLEDMRALVFRHKTKPSE